MKNHAAQTASLSFDVDLSQNEAMNLILNNVEDIFLLVNKDLKVILANKATKDKINKFFGVTLVQGMSILSLAPGERHPYLIKLYEEVFNGAEKTSQTEIVISGVTQYFEHHFKPAKNENGGIVGAVVISKDVTEKKAKTKELADVEERWRFALDAAKQGVWDWNMQTGEVFFSDTYKTIYGFEKDELKNRIEEWRTRVHPDDSSKIDEAIKNHISATNPYFESTYRIQAKNGQYKWILARGTLISRDAEGKPLRMIGTHTDITEQLRVEESYKILFYNNPLPMWTYDIDTLKFLAVNDAAINHYGYSKEEFLSMTIADIQPPIDIGKLKELIEHRKDYIIFNSLWQHKKKNGEIITVEISTSKLNKNENAVLVVAHDVTSKAVAEEELRKSNERFIYAAKASSEALWEWDVLNEEAYISETYTQILGWKANEFRKFDEWHDYIHPDDKKETTESYYTAIKNPDVERWEKEYRYLKSDGTYAFVMDKASILRNEEGKAVKVIGALQNITAQKEIEADLKRSNERFLLASRAASDAIYEWDVVTNELHWGEGLSTLFGFHPKEVPIAIWEKLIHPEDRDRISKNLSDALTHRRKKLWKEEYRFIKKDGSYAHVLDRGFFVRDEDGNTTRIIGSMQDITERKYNEQLLSLKKTILERSADPGIELKKIAEELLIGIEKIHSGTTSSILLLKDDDTVEHLAAPSLPFEFALGINGLKIGPKEGSCGAAMFLKETVIVADINTDPLWGNYKDFASQFNIKACWSLPIIHSSGKVMGSFAIYYNIIKYPTSAELLTIERIRNILRIVMENRWSLQEIKVANERFDIMMKATHDLIWDWDLKTNVVYRDEHGLKKVYGIKDNSSIENLANWLTHIHPEDKARVEKVIHTILQATEQNNFDVEYRFKREDGTYSNVYDRGIIIRDTEGKPLRMIGAAQDVSERKRLEKEILTFELEHQKAISQATIDTQERERSEIGKELHDNVNQVLTTTKLYMDLALSNPEMKDELIHKSTKNIIMVINEIRQLSRSLMDPSIGDLGLIDSIHDLIENINLTRKLHVSLFAQKKIEHLLNKAQKLTVFRIIQETLNNAIKHAKATSVTIHFNNSINFVEVTIKDDGIGFDSKTVKKGSGLKNIENRIYLINGKHSIESLPGKGSKITINFPVIKTNT